MKYPIAALIFASLSATGASAQSQGDITLGFGIGSVIPASNNGTLAGGSADVANSVRPTITVEYFIRDNLGIELLASAPFEHDISINGAFAGSTRQLPPTISLNYHFPTQSAFKPYVGAGINYTTFFKEESALGVLELDDSVGLSLQVGLDYVLANGNAWRTNLRWFDIDSDASLNGVDIGTAEIDPYALNFAYVVKF